MLPFLAPTDEVSVNEQLLVAVLNHEPVSYKLYRPPRYEPNDPAIWILPNEQTQGMDRLELQRFSGIVDHPYQPGFHQGVIQVEAITVEGNAGRVQMSWVRYNNRPQHYQTYWSVEVELQRAADAWQVTALEFWEPQEEN